MLNLSDFLDEPVSVSQPSEPVQTPAQPKIQPYKDTYSKGRTYVTRPSDDNGNGRVLDAVIDEKTGKIKVIGETKVKPEPNYVVPKSAFGEQSKSGAKSTSSKQDFVALDDDMINDAIEAVDSAPVEVPEVDPKTLAAMEDKDKGIAALRKRLVIKVRRFKDSKYCAPKFNVRIIPDDYEDLPVAMLNELLDLIRDDIGRHESPSIGREALKFAPTAIAAGVNMMDNGVMGIKIDPVKYRNNLNNNDFYQTAVEEVDIDYFETSYTNPFMRIAMGLMGSLNLGQEKDNATYMVQPKNTYVVADGPVSAEDIIAEAEKKLKRRPIQD